MDALAKDAYILGISTDNLLPVMDKITSCCEAELRASNLYIVRQQNLPQPLTTFLANRNSVSSILRLRIGHSRLKSHLYKIGLEDSPYCTVFVDCQKQMSMSYCIGSLSQEQTVAVEKCYFHIKINIIILTRTHI